MMWVYVLPKLSDIILQVSIAPRDICSRMNTFMLETTKPASREDKESLVVERVSK